MRALACTLSLALAGCSVELPPVAVLQATLPQCRVTVCDEACEKCASYVPENENPPCEVAVCGELQVSPGGPGTCPVVVITRDDP